MHVAQKGLTEGEVDQVVDWCRDTDNWLTKYVCLCVHVCVCVRARARAQQKSNTTNLTLLNFFTTSRNPEAWERW